MIESDLPFGTSAARMLMRIADSPHLSKRDHGHVLPTSWRTLYELSKLDEQSFAEALARGAIHPDMERNEAALLRTAERRIERLERVDRLARDSRPGTGQDRIARKFSTDISKRTLFASRIGAGGLPSFIDFAGPGSASAFVVSKNLHRRHLSESQRALVAGRLANLQRGDVSVQRREEPVESDGGQICPPRQSITEAAELLSVSPRSVKSAKVVLAEGTPEQVAAVAAGTASVSAVTRWSAEGERGSPGRLYP